jgi:Tol biopolymer transport system component
MTVSAMGVEPDNDSFRPSLSVDGRYVVFESYATNMVKGDTNNVADVFIRDRTRSLPRRVSLNSAGQQANDFSVHAAVSAFGRYVAFSSGASNLDHGDTNGVMDVFVRDIRKGVTHRVSKTSLGAQASGQSGFDSVAISADGQRVLFDSTASDLVPRDTNGVGDLFVRDVRTGRTERVSVASNGHQADAASYGASISADGRFVAFTSAASNLVPGDTNGTFDVFVRDLVRGVTRRVSVSSRGAQAADQADSTTALTQEQTISWDGRFVVFESVASNLVPGDTNGVKDVFVRDTRRGTTERASVGAAGQQGDDISSGAAISLTGRFVVFGSLADNLVDGDTGGVNDVFIRDRRARTTKRISVGVAGEEPNSGSAGPTVSADGNYIAFFSDASNLTPDGNVHHNNVFLRRNPWRIPQPFGLR